MASLEELKSKVDDVDFILRCQDDFVFFTEEVLGFKLAQFHKDQVSQAMNERLVCIVNPVGHSKTTVYSVSYAIWRLWRERNFEICLVSSSLDQSKKIMSIVQGHIETNPFLQSLVPLKKDVAWNKFETTTSNGNYYYVKPLNSTIRGIHPNLIICDDLMRETNLPMQDLKDLFWGVIFGRLHTKKGQIIVVGTPQSEVDLFNDIRLKSGKDGQWLYMHQPAVIIDELGNWIRPLWPEKFTLEEFRFIEESMGKHRFAREYLCNPASGGLSLYNPSDIGKCCDDNLGFKTIVNPDDGPIYIGCDFALSSSPSGDYSVFTVIQQLSTPYEKVCKTEDGIEFIDKINEAIVIRKVERFKGVAFENQIQRIIELNDIYKPKLIIVDASNFGGPFLTELTRRNIPVDGQVLPASTRNALLVNVAKFIEKNSSGQRRLVIPTSQTDSGTYETTKRLILELGAMQETDTRSGTRTFQSVIDHDDCVFSLALALRDVQVAMPMTNKLIFTA